LYWTWVSRVRQIGGRKLVSKEVRALIFRMVVENPTWGAPRIHGELLKLGFDLSERSGKESADGSHWRVYRTRVRTPLGRMVTSGLPFISRQYSDSLF
jgi:hypothetical protein